MSLIQELAPTFTAEAVYPDGSIGPLCLADYRGKYVVLVFYPMDFTFVCPTEIIAFSSRIEEFRARGAEVLGVSVDSVHAHAAWRSIDETLRLLDALKHLEQYGEVCPANWHEGQRAMQATPEGFKAFVQAAG
jgi:alkyl hydroperoxide reductase subunit AhpC